MRAWSACPIENIETEHDELRTGTCYPTSKWQCEVDIEAIHPIDIRLKEIFDRYPEVSSLYEAVYFEDPIWVINRWIELLPVGAQQKQHFLSQQDCSKVLHYLTQLIE